LIPPLFGGGLGKRGPEVSPFMRPLGVGKWKFRGFEVAAPHPLSLGMARYSWLRGMEVPWGAKTGIPTVRKVRRGTGGLTRVVR